MRTYHDVVQGSREWWKLHLGIPTASNFGRILTSAKLDYSKGADGYAAELIAEKLLGRPLDWGVSLNEEGGKLSTIWTERGTDMEEEARKWYAFHRDLDVTQVGFVTIQEGEIGGSPDGLAGDDGVVEIKCRAAKMHARAMCGVDKTADRLQTQGYLWLTGRDWVDVVAYNDVLPKRIDRAYRDKTVIDALTAQVNRFLNERDKLATRLAELGDVIETGDELTQQLIASIREGSA